MTGVRTVSKGRKIRVKVDANGDIKGGFVVEGSHGTERLFDY